MARKRLGASEMRSGKRAQEHAVKMVTAGAYALDAFRNVAQSGGFERIVLVADWTHFMVRGELQGGGYATLAKTKGGGSRHFLNPAAAIMMLHRMGIVRLEIEMEKWDLEMSSLSMRMRPD